LWVVLTEERSGIGACRYGSNLHLGMAKQQAEELSARITSGTRHRSPYGHSHEYAIHDNFMHMGVSKLEAR
jgi:hypothetical protein